LRGSVEAENLQKILYLIQLHFLLKKKCKQFTSFTWNIWTLSCSYLCTDVTISRKNPTNEIKVCLYRFIHTVTLPHFSAQKGLTWGSTDTFREQVQQNTCPDVMFTAGPVFCWSCSRNISLLPQNDPVWTAKCMSVTVWIKRC